MASCKKCGVSVGCGCNLKDGLCQACYEASKNIIKTVKHALYKAFRLS